MIPSAWVQLDNLPINSNGKVDKKALPETNLDDNSDREFVAPESEIELQMAEIWKGLLNIEQITVHYNFFDLGGHSLMALLIISAMRKQLYTEIEIIELLNHPTIFELSRIIEANSELELNHQKVDLLSV